MTKKTSEGRKGAVKGRVQALNPKTGRWVKIDTKKGTIVDHKATSGPYKGGRKTKANK